LKEKEFQPKPLLTKREREVFELLVQDKTTKEIASELFISEKNSSQSHFKCNAKAWSQGAFASSGRAPSYGGT
jgi:FixJ family two-component response regulator